jgi:hypothetical protein
VHKRVSTHVAAAMSSKTLVVSAPLSPCLCLPGTLPASWANLTRLREVYLAQNSLEGPLPPSWGALSKLLAVDLFQNRLSGAPPGTWSGMKSLKELDLSRNRLIGKASGQR